MSVLITHSDDLHQNTYFIEMLFSFPAYLPPASDYDIQQQRNRLKHAVNEEDRASLLEATFADRRQHVVTLGTPMKKFLKLYPVLRDREEVRNGAHHSPVWERWE